MKLYVLVVCLCVVGVSVCSFQFKKKSFPVFQRAVSTIQKRNKQAGGSCTCTCETKPLNNNNNPNNNINHYFYNDHDEHDNNNNRNAQQHKSMSASDEDSGAGEEGVDGGEKEIKNMSTEWGHKKRFPWQDLPDRDCYRDSCKHEGNCCKSFNICDQSAMTCIDCWHGMSCSSEANCCMRFPYCKKSKNAADTSGRCVEEM